MIRLESQSLTMLGIIGRLGDLGGIPRKYDVALSSSCNVNPIIVETTTQGKEIVDYLRKDNVGSVTIYALEKMPQFREASRDLPGPRLVDQIRCDDQRLMNCFYKVPIYTFPFLI